MSLLIFSCVVVAIVAVILISSYNNIVQLRRLFVLSIAAIIVAIYIATLFLFHFAPRIWWYPPLFIVVASVTTAVIVVPSLYKFICLWEGGKAIAKELGGRLLPLETVDAQERQLLNIVQEMAIASGISVPSVYLLHLEPGINAFAAGFSPNTAVIGVTRGCLEHLNRDELQGVIGHEFSHILNGDMGLNLRLVALLHGILFIYQTGLLIVTHFSRGNVKEKKFYKKPHLRRTAVFSNELYSSLLTR